MIATDPGAPGLWMSEGPLGRDIRHKEWMGSSDFSSPVDLGGGGLLARLVKSVGVWEGHCLAAHVSVQSTELLSDF